MTTWLWLAAWIGGTPARPPADVAAAPPEALATASGVAMTVLQAGQGKDHPEANDCVTVHFTAWRRDGSFLASSRPAGAPESQCLKAMFPGVAEALRTMVVGEERRLWVPAALTYPDDDDAPPRADVTFDVELLEIQKAPPTPRDLTAPPSARKTPTGLALEVLRNGRGREHPRSGSVVTVHFSGWTAHGQLIESSVMGGQPATYELESVMPGWRETLQTMVVGQQVRLWIPAALAFGEKPRRGQPRGDLVYELELLDLR